MSMYCNVVLPWLLDIVVDKGYVCWIYLHVLSVERPHFNFLTTNHFLQ